ncbi:metallophosphoesterase family protein [Tenacibaculum mesophilum]|uniref:hypothetical protein n=1 Tax=Tenacibaculum mesophilum TaxID=104268 RepID=UPI000F629F3E|nr:hypothetical protein [Tenacibaculum mesophilum]QFS29029.1 hypothetical protein F9Y86_11725 [Tenacibaculum mesophilum]
MIIIFIISSCGDHYLTSSNGLRSKNFYKRYIDKRINPNTIEIKTDIIYIDSHYYKNGELFKSENAKKDYFRFYKNGTCYRFNDYGSKNLNKLSFNPKKGDIGFTIKKGKKYFLMTYSIIDGGGFSQSEIRMKDDTLVIYSKNGKDEFFSYFKKMKVPREWLDWKPDY